MNTSSSSASTSSISTNKTLYRVQTGAYNNKDKAEAEVKKLKAAGYNAFIITENSKTTAPSTVEFKVGDKVKIKHGAYVYGTKTKFASFIYSSTLYVRHINGDKITISTQKTGTITGAVSKEDLIKV